MYLIPKEVTEIYWFNSRTWCDLTQSAEDAPTFRLRQAQKEIGCRNLFGNMVAEMLAARHREEAQALCRKRYKDKGRPLRRGRPVTDICLSLQAQSDRTLLRDSTPRRTENGSIGISRYPLVCGESC